MYKKVIYIQSIAAEALMKVLSVLFVNETITFGYDYKEKSFAIICEDFYDYIGILPMLDYCVEKYSR